MFDCFILVFFCHRQNSELVLSLNLSTGTLYPKLIILCTLPFLILYAAPLERADAARPASRRSTERADRHRGREFDGVRLLLRRIRVRSAGAVQWGAFVLQTMSAALLRTDRLWWVSYFIVVFPYSAKWVNVNYATVAVSHFSLLFSSFLHLHRQRPVLVEVHVHGRSVRGIFLR